jgi:predicted metal-dependent hydrolase
LIKKASWITKSRQRLLEKKGKPLQFRDGEELFFLGNSYPVHYRSWEKKRSRLHFEESEGFTIDYSDFDTKHFETLVNHFYKQKAQELIPELVQQYSEEMNLYPTKISFRKAKRRWGSCSSNDAISLKVMRERNLKYILTSDKDFEGIKELVVINPLGDG